MPESPAAPAALPTPSAPVELSAEDGKLVILA
ncbi:cytidine deaminase, partial [Micromonospora sp. Rc5]